MPIDKTVTMDMVNLAWVAGGGVAASMTALCCGFWALHRYVESRREKGDEALRHRLDVSVKCLNTRMSGVRDDFVRREDYRETINRIEDRLDKLDNAISIGFKDVSKRIDSLIVLRSAPGGE